MSEVGNAAPEILLIDYNPGDARRVAEALPTATPAAKLSAACHGSEGLRFPRHEDQYATALTPDLILLDLRMPKKSGVEVLAEVKQYPVLKSIPLVVLTGSAAPRVHVSAELKGQEWVFSVRDNGIGLKPQYAGRIFMVFQRLHRRDEYTGTGGGPAISRKIVEHHGGRFWVESEPGKGAAFRLTAPVSSLNAKV